MNQPRTILQMADAIVDKIMGPSAYSDVAMMNHVADILSNEGMSLAFTEPERAARLLTAACEIGAMADKLDRELMEKFVASWPELVDNDQRDFEASRGGKQ